MGSFEANEFVFDFTTGLLVHITSIARIIEIKQAGNMFVTNGLILRSSLTAEGKRVKDYAASFQGIDSLALFGGRYV